MMDQLISVLKQFETRNNISACIIVNSDGSFGVMEFWTEEDLGSFDSAEGLLKFLSQTQYALDEKGLCLNPYQIK
jgi:hypothetical protein